MLMEAWAAIVSGQPAMLRKSVSKNVLTMANRQVLNGGTRLIA